VRDDTDIPWELIRDVMRRAPGWARTIDGMAGSGEPPRCGRGSTVVSLSEAAAWWYDLCRALKVLRDNGPGSPRRPADAKVLAYIVDGQLQGAAYGAIAFDLRHSKVRCMRHGEFWTKTGVASALERAYCWLCHPAYGRLLTWEEWRGGRQLEARKG
jgi:hypothetical protein